MNVLALNTEGDGFKTLVFWGGLTVSARTCETHAVIDHACAASAEPSHKWPSSNVAHLHDDEPAHGHVGVGESHVC